MRNIDRIRQMSLEELAPLLVYFTEVDEGDYDWDENPIPYYVLVWHSPSGAQCWTEEDAIEDCIEWLDSKYTDEVKNDND